MSTLYQSSKDVPTEVLSARLNQLSHVVSSNRERIDAELTVRIPAEVDRDADLVMSEAAVRLEALQAENAQLVEALEEIINPIRFMEERLEEGERLNGMAAVQLAGDASYLRGIARAVLATHRKQQETNHDNQ